MPNNGNGHGTPHPINATPSAPSPEAGAPAGPSAEAPAGALIRDPKTGRITKGHSLNPKGRPPGIPNVNLELIRAVKQFKVGNKRYLEALLIKSLSEPDLARAILDKITVDATPTSAGVAIHNHNGDTNTETHVRIGEFLHDAGVRGAVAQLAEQLASRGALAPQPRATRNGGSAPDA